MNFLSIYMGLYIKVKEIRQIREIAIHLIFSRGDNPPPPNLFRVIASHFVRPEENKTIYILRKVEHINKTVRSV